VLLPVPAGADLLAILDRGDQLGRPPTRVSQPPGQTKPTTPIAVPELELATSELMLI